MFLCALIYFLNHRCLVYSKLKSVVILTLSDISGTTSAKIEIIPKLRCAIVHC